MKLPGPLVEYWKFSEKERDMKSKHRKIRLQRETLRRLGQASLDQIVGGRLAGVEAPDQADSEPLSSGHTWCGCKQLV